MVEQLVSFEVAQLAKNYGFSIIQRYGHEASLYSNVGKYCYYANYGFMGSGLNDGYISAPTQSFLQKWFREVHNIEIKVWAEHYLNGTNWCVQALKFNLSEKYMGDPNKRDVLNDFIEDGTYSFGDNNEYKTYEEALEKGLLESFKLIKK
jgi:hypothetical protein